MAVRHVEAGNKALQARTEESKSPYTVCRSLKLGSKWNTSLHIPCVYIFELIEFLIIKSDLSQARDLVH